MTTRSASNDTAGDSASSTDTRVTNDPPSGEGEKLGLSERVDDLEKRIDGLEKRREAVLGDFQRLERKMNQASTWLLSITALVATGFCITGIMVAIDYLYTSRGHYATFIDRMSELESNLRTKEEANRNVTVLTTQAIEQISSFKKCLQQGGWEKCF